MAGTGSPRPSSENVDAQSIDSLRRRTDSDPDNALAWVKLGEKLIHSGDLVGAVAALDQALTLKPKMPWGRYWTGVALAKQRRNSEAEVHLRYAFENIAASPWPGHALAKALSEQDRHDEACEILRQTLSAHPGNQTVSLALVSELRKCNSFGEAIGLVKELKDRDPENASLVHLIDQLESEHEQCIFDVPSSPAIRGSIGGPEAIQNGSGQDVQRKVKVIALYLPQFHPIPENDRWWGKGFTEWTNVVRSRPLFNGHYQPRIPADLGFYDLRVAEVQQAQAEMAEEFGIHGFCYYYYWFSGRKLLNMPIERMLHSGTPNLPFCVCWANENWSRNWDGQHQHILQEQHYSPESNRALIQELIPMFKDARYIRHHGRPVFLVYRIQIIPDWLETARIWREECRRAGVGEIHLCAVRFGLEPLEGQPSDFGVDAYVSMPPHETVRVDIKSQVRLLDPNFRGELFSYAAVVDGDLEHFKDGYPWPVHRGAMLGWDNTARRQTAARIFHGATPLLFHSWLKGILEQEDRFNPDDESLQFIMAWNEWAEGSYLEPDKKFGARYLQAVKAALSRYRRDPPRIRKPINEEFTAAAGHGETKGYVPLSTCIRKSYLRSFDRARRLVAPLWFPGGGAANEGFQTIMLAAHISGAQLYGAERSFIDVLDALMNMPFNVIATVPSGRNTQYLAEIRSRCVGAYAFPYPQWRANRDVDEWSVACFADIIARHNISLVHANTIVIPEPLVAAHRMNRLACVHARELITLDEGLCDQIGQNAQEIIRKVFANSDFLIANSIATERTFARQGRTFYVPNAVHHHDFDIPNVVGETVRFGIVSSNIPKKGIVDFIEVAKICNDQIINAEFIVVGPENSQVGEWKKDVDAGRLPANLKFVGYRSSPQQAMAELNVLLNLSSFGESFGRTVAEALASERPVIAYEWGAIPEILRHGETGLLAPYRDVRRVAELVRSLCAQPQLILDMGKRGRRFVANNYSPKKLLHHLQQAYDVMFRRAAEAEGARPASSCFSPIAEFGEVPKATTIVIPVHNAHDAVDNCLASVIRHTPLATCRVVVIDDKSTDPRIEALLNRYVGVHGFDILKNDKNLGYTKTINIGIRHADANDVVLLNSDTVVTPGWLEGLRSTAYSAGGIATVTAMSDNAGAFSFPVRDEKNLKPDGISYDDYALMLVQGSGRCSPADVPTGSGFCMFIRRSVINEIGVFDEDAFPRGYGEENDFCMRALRAGWRNLITPWAYVFHIRSASFGAEREKLITAALDVLRKRYPDYADLVKASFASDEVNALRSALSLARASIYEAVGEDA
jgi:GT2 family glycosyltransferase/glycosyltransferase involved in cell wall biosynthesis/tetratricopeptide (TPR) repeat protein